MRTLGEPDLVYDVDDDPGERAPLEDAALSAAADERWDLEALDRRVRSSQSGAGSSRTPSHRQDHAVGHPGGSA